MTEEKLENVVEETNEAVEETSAESEVTETEETVIENAEVEDNFENSLVDSKEELITEIYSDDGDKVKYSVSDPSIEKTSNNPYPYDTCLC